MNEAKTGDNITLFFIEIFIASGRILLTFCKKQTNLTACSLYVVESMVDYILLIISTALINNFVLVKFLGLCPFMGVSKKVETAIGMGLATTFVLTVASLSAYLLETYLLVLLNAQFLRTLVFILVIAVIVQLTEMIVHKTSPTLYRLLGIYLPLITTNCAVLGVALLNVNLANNLVESVLYGFSAAAGFSLVLVLFAALRERLAAADVPRPFQGASIALITAGLMSLAFMGFTGLVKL
ncbi:Electron transport complex protein rnfA [Mannheimia varigena USDA-ARS-USMARC-1388]|nr:Electron transport complex protein rnfA [Mannheimia varigena USDA-ARS-USMARC-1388]